MNKIYLSLHQVVDFVTAWLFSYIFFPTIDDFLIFSEFVPPDWLTEVTNRWRAHKVLALFTNILSASGGDIAELLQIAALRLNFAFKQW